MVTHGWPVVWVYPAPVVCCAGLVLVLNLLF
jgi:hypothetical protein